MINLEKKKSNIEELNRIREIQKEEKIKNIQKKLNEDQLFACQIKNNVSLFNKNQYERELNKRSKTNEYKLELLKQITENRQSKLLIN